MLQKVPLYVTKSTLICYKKYPYMLQKVPLYVTKSTLIAYSISLFIGNCEHLKDIKYFKRYKNLLKYFIKKIDLINKLWYKVIDKRTKLKSGVPPPGVKSPK